jgi:hypothetical protein
MRMASSGFLEKQIAQVAIDEAHSTQTSSSPPSLQSRAPGDAASDQSGTKGGGREAFFDPSSEDDPLRRAASQFIYVRLGRVGEKRLATLVDLNTYEKETQVEGSIYKGVRIEQVEEESILLTHPAGGQLRKPRIEMEIDPSLLAPSDPQARAERQARYNEMWGNRLNANRAETSFARQDPAQEKAELQRREAARQRYLEKLGPFLEQVRAGDPTVDLRNHPFVSTVEEGSRERERRIRDGIEETANPK